MPNIKAVAYARYSTDKQNETSILVQIKEIKSFCAKNNIQLLDNYYADEASSGTNMERTAFQQLLSDCNSPNRQFNAIIFYDISRGSRDIADWFTFRKNMQKLGIKVISATNTLGEIDDPNSFIQEFITVGLGQHMVLQTRQKSIAGQRLRAESGKFCGGHAPLGYDIVDGRYVINEREAEAIQTMFTMYAKGESLGAIADMFKEKGILSRMGKNITRNSVHYLLKNKRYDGTYTWFENENRYMKQWVGRKGSDPVLIEDAIPAIVSKDLMQVVTERMRVNQHKSLNKSRANRVYLLSGLIKCEQCGGSYVGITRIAKGVEYTYYTCVRKRKHKDCKAKDIRADKLDNYVLSLLSDTILNGKNIDKLYEMLLQRLSTQAQENHSNIKNEIVSLKQKNNHLMHAVENGLVVGETIQRINTNAEIIKKLEQKLSNVPTALTPNASKIKSKLLSDIYALQKLLGSELSTVNQKSIRQLVNSYIKSVTIGQEIISITVFFNYSQNKKFTNDNTLVNSAGSPGGTRTYNPSVNSRVLCH